MEILSATINDGLFLKKPESNYLKFFYNKFIFFSFARLFNINNSKNEKKTINQHGFSCLYGINNH